MSDAPEKPEFWTRPIFSVADVRASCDYYCSKLGFTVAWSADSEQMVIAQVERPGIELILQNGTRIPSSKVPAVLALELHEHVKLDDLHRELEQRGAKIRAAPAPVYWQENTRQMEVEDLDGNLLLFWAP
ncbi:MAG TPA: VOC family protein [Polyangiales bacterium]|nr:VOC family protein [Polyangiales bacterium]